MSRLYHLQAGEIILLSRFAEFDLGNKYTVNLGRSFLGSSIRIILLLMWELNHLF
jgi:hypothetical protein